MHEIKTKAYIPVNEMVYRIDEERFQYNKDSDEWFCSEGNDTVSKKYKVTKEGKQKYVYYFEKEKCRNCKKRGECKPGSRISRVLEVGIRGLFQWFRTVPPVTPGHFIPAPYVSLLIIIIFNICGRSSRTNLYNVPFSQ